MGKKNPGGKTQRKRPGGKTQGRKNPRGENPGGETPGGETLRRAEMPRGGGNAQGAEMPRGKNQWFPHQGGKPRGVRKHRKKNPGEEKTQGGGRGYTIEDFEGDEQKNG